MRVFLSFLIIKALFCFSEGKPCPEKYRPHKTRCDAYYKCVILPTKSHVWMPAKCERGLVFEPNLNMCVLPGDDWECNLGENISKTKLDDNNIYGIDILKITPDAPTKSLNNLKPKINENTVKLVEFIELSNDSNKNFIEENDNIPISSSNLEKSQIIEDQNNESSGDGPIEISIDEHKNSKLRENYDELPESTESSKVDPKLKSQLQRLSQLIEGLQNTYKGKGTSNSNTELRPDQLNAFLAHFNIKNEFDLFNPNNSDDIKSELNQSDHKNITNLLRNKNKIQKNNITSLKPILNNDSTIKVTKLSPETKVILKNSGYRRQEYNSDENRNGYNTNSQIVVNRPEGSVVFSLANPQKQYPEQKYSDSNKHDPYDYNTVPKISEDTLKTVLELSKQMISNQNVPQIISNLGAMYHPFLAPVYYPPAPIPPVSYHYTNPSDSTSYSNYHHNNQHKSEEHNDNNYNKFQSTAYISNTKENLPNRTTVIQNSYIPVHITTNADKGHIERPETLIKNSANPYNNLENIINRISNLPTNYNSKYSSSHDITNIQNPIRDYGIGLTPPAASMTIATTTEYPYKYPPSPPNKHISFLNYYTPNPHLDDSNANSVFESADEDRYPMLSSQYDQLQSDSNFQYQQLQNNHKTNQFESHIKQTPNFDVNNNDHYIYQTNIKIPSTSTQSNKNNQATFQQQQQPLLLNMGLGSSSSGSNSNSVNNINTNINSQMEQMNEFESDSSALTSLNYHIDNSSPNDLNKQKYTQFVTNQLSHQNLDQQYSYLNGNHNNLQSAVSNVSPSLFSSLSSSSSSSSSSSPTNNLHNNNNNNYNGINTGGSNALVNLGGNYISYDIYKNKLLPALESAAGLNNNNNNNIGNNNNNNQLFQPNVEIVTCTAGIRQPNSTDCTKYFVCSRKDSKILSYSCPPYTAFNSQTRICDAKTYAVCNPELLFNRFTIQDNQKLQLDAIKALQDAKRIRDEVIQAQTLANLIRYQTEQALNQTLSKPNQSDSNAFLNPTLLSNLLSSYTSIETPTNNNIDNNIMMASATISSTSSTTTMKPILQHHKHKKRKYYCREGDKIPDQTSDSNYFVCYKTKDGAMHGHKMICSSGLMFCSKTKLCTTARICNN